MLRGVNDGEGEAHQLGALLQGRDMVLNLIPWNPIYSPDIAFEASCPLYRTSACRGLVSSAVHAIGLSGGCLLLQAHGARHADTPPAA